jgi:hypothetical protein
MKSHLKSSLLAAAVTLLAAPGVHGQTESPIPRSMAGDKGKYYLIEAKKTGDSVVAVHKRVGVDSVGFTKTETNCKTRQMRELGYGEGSPKSIKGRATKWFDLVPGSSKSDVAAFVCKW